MLHSLAGDRSVLASRVGCPARVLPRRPLPIQLRVLRPLPTHYTPCAGVGPRTLLSGTSSVFRLSGTRTFATMASAPCIFIADIGGTNARYQLWQLNDDLSAKDVIFEKVRRKFLGLCVGLRCTVSGRVEG